MKNGGSFHCYVAVHQRVIMVNLWLIVVKLWLIMVIYGD